MSMINWLSSWLENDNTKVLYLLTLILIANVIDFSAGWLNAKFNKNVDFSSNKAIFGILRKMLLFITCVFFVPVALLIPAPIGIGAMYVLFLGYLGSEVNSILSHFGFTKDDKTGNLFIEFIGTIFNRGDKK